MALLARHRHVRYLFLMSSSMETIAPGFLIAAPMLQDPNFDGTVVLMCVHNEQGAMGLVINRPSPMTLGDIMEQLGVSCVSSFEQTAMVGGPVALDSGLLLYEADPASELGEGELAVTDRLRLCPNREMLHQIGRGEGPLHYVMFLGHSGWGPGQLEWEFSQGAWIPAHMRDELIFDTPVEQRWEEALRGEGLHPGQMGTFKPQA
jgi:putative transcriptional regulator